MRGCLTLHLDGNRLLNPSCNHQWQKKGASPLRRWHCCAPCNFSNYMCRQTWRRKTQSVSVRVCVWHRHGGRKKGARHSLVDYGNAKGGSTFICSQNNKQTKATNEEKQVSMKGDRQPKSKNGHRQDLDTNMKILGPTTPPPRPKKWAPKGHRQGARSRTHWAPATPAPPGR